MVEKQNKKTDAAAVAVKRLYSTKEAAKMWGISYDKLLELVDEGRIRPIVGMGKGWRWDGSEFASVQFKRL
jgi:excisionase family DNA binding protein